LEKPASFLEHRTVVCFLLALAVALAFSPVLRNGFTSYDDPAYVVQNPHVNTGLSLDNAAWAMVAAHSSNWHPLTWISHQFDITLFGLSPAGHHLTSLLLHIANTMLLFLWLRGATGFHGRSAFVALAFALHPLHVESVAWVAERKDVLCGLFWLLALLAYTRYAKRPSLPLYLVVAALFTGALLSKPMAVTLPFLLLLLDWWPLSRFEREPAARLVQEKLPLLALSILSGWMTLWAQRQSAFVPTLEEWGLAARLSNAVVSVAAYLVKMLWPVRLAVFYPMPSNGPSALAVLASVAALALITLIAFRTRRSRPWLLVGWCWYLITLIPVIGLVQAGRQAMADRYMYMPMIGLLLLVVWECAIAARRLRVPAVAPAAAAVVLAVWAGLTWQQCHVWKDQMTLFHHALAVTENNFVAHDNLGTELEVQGRADEALWHFREALRIQPGDPTTINNLAVASYLKGEQLYNSGRPDEALPYLREALRYHPANAAGHNYVGQILTTHGQLPEAIAEFRAVIASDPTNTAAQMGLGIALERSGQAAGAQQAFEAVLTQSSSNAGALYHLGLARAAQGHTREALDSFDAALNVNPGLGAAQAARAELLFHLGQFPEAWKAAQAAREAGASVDPAVASKLAARFAH
jgi:protein O-mannosyl-transferase